MSLELAADVVTLALAYDVDATMEEVAASLGASLWQTLWRVIFPELCPDLLTGFCPAAGSPLSTQAFPSLTRFCQAPVFGGQGCYWAQCR
jgi:ABC-type methionine transport system permease subunit